MLATTDATYASLDCAPHALFRRVATADLGIIKDTRTAGAVAARLHLCSAIAGTLVFLEGPLNRKRRFAFTLEVIRVVLLRER